MSNPITGQYNQQPTTSFTLAPSEETLLNAHAAEFIPGNSQHNDRSVRTIHPTSSLSSNEIPVTMREHSQLNNFTVQVTQREQRHNSWLNPVGCADNYDGHQYADDFLQPQQQNPWQNPVEYGTNYEGFQQTGAFFQSRQQNPWQNIAGYGTSYEDLQQIGDFFQTQQQNPWQNIAEYGTSYEDLQQTGNFFQTQQQNPWQNSAEYVAYQHAGDFFQTQQQNSWQTTAECEASYRDQQLLKDDVTRNPQASPQSLPSSNKSSRSPGFANETPQKNSTTDRAVNTLIQRINNLYTSKNKDISKQVVICFNYFKTDIGFLTDDHRKQLLRIIPTISEIIDKRNLNNISTVTILYSLSKTEFFYKINPNNTSENECIRYEQESINLIDKILTKTLQTHEKHSERDWSNIFYALGLLAEQSPYLITKDQTNKLLNTFNFFIQKQTTNKLQVQVISNIFLGVIKLLKSNKLDSKSITTYSLIEYLLQQTRCNINQFIPQHFSNTIHSIIKLSDEFSEFKQLIFKNINIIESLLKEIVKKENLKWKDIEISEIFYSLGQITASMGWNKELCKSIKATYKFFLDKIYPMASNMKIATSNSILSGIVKLIVRNIINKNKPSKNLIRDIFLNKIIANPSIINTSKLYQRLYTITFFQEYLTKSELIRTFENITFFIPDTDLKTYFTSMGYLLVKIRKELNNDKENKDLLNLEHKVTTEIKKVCRLFHDNIENVDHGTRSAMHNTCSLVDEIINLDCLKLNYKYLSEHSKHSKLEHICLDIIKTLIPNPENLQQEYVTNNLPPIDACITYPDGSLIAIEIQGPGHYIDNEGKHPTGRHLLKMARLQKENITVIEVNATTLMSYNDFIEIASYLIKLLLENNIEIRPEYYYNIPQLLKDAGITP